MKSYARIVAPVCFSFLFATLVMGQIANHVVISEMFTGGGSSNSSVLYQRDWVELYNPTSSPVDVTGWTIQYKSATGTGTYGAGTALSGTIPAYGFYLIVSGTAGTGGVALPLSADADISLNLSGSSGRVVLCNDGTLVTAGSEGSATNLVDFVGYGTVNSNEGASAAPGASLTASLERKAQASSTAVTLASGGADEILGNGYDSNDNGNDLVSQSAPNPQNTGSAIEDNSSLPVEMTSFSATANHLTANIHWSTATEVNNFGFEIERKTVHSEWAKIGFVTGVGSSNSLHNYAYSDNVGQAGMYDYRIKQIDKNGGFKYSSVMQVEIGTAPKVLSLGANYPNPFNPTTNIEFSVPNDGRVVLKVYNVLGQEVAILFDGDALAGRLMKTSFDASRLTSGVYFSRLEYNGQAIVKRMILMK
jgi:hypothetical protein